MPRYGVGLNELLGLIYGMAPRKTELNKTHRKAERLAKTGPGNTTRSRPIFTGQGNFKPPAVQSNCRRLCNSRNANSDVRRKRVESLVAHVK